MASQPASSLPNVSCLVSIKLDGDNYTLWLAQFLPVLRSNELMGYVDGTKPCPRKLQDDGTTISADYITWQKQDQQLLSWIVSTLSPTVLATVTRCATSQEVWQSLQRRYSSQSRSRVLQLKHQLQTTKRGNLSITAYIDKMRNIADKLVLAGKPVDDEDFIDLILNGVGAAFESTVNSILSREKAATLDDVTALLLNAETRMEDYHSSLPSDGTSNALFASQPHSSYQGRGRGGSFVSRGRAGSSSGNRSGFTNSGPTVNRGGSSFSASRGSNSFRSNFNSSRPGALSQGRGGTYGSFLAPSTNQVRCQFCGGFRHTAINCHRLTNLLEGRMPPQQLSSTALVAASPSGLEKTDTWYADSGASTHVTADLGNLQLHTPYPGSDQVAVGNGAGLAISNIGSTSLSGFKLNHVLHCPSVSANLLSVNQFAKDNNCYFILTSDSFFVKDTLTGKTLFQGKSENGLYPFRPSLPVFKAFAVIGERTSSFVWHQRLGHPSSVVFQKIASCVPLSHSESKFCSSCPMGKSTKLPFSLSSSVS
ncbi:uncharacterized protein LOC110748445, partial [Prunus avium]|uniref:Uncharacterized protein LOC110748445 n=1 Tax=Prunus avium TaxID=42229 RepID=A0A6P5RND2_PRUAV